MKTITSTLVAALICIASFSSFAGTIDGSKSSSPSSLVISNYLAAVSLGDFEKHTLSFTKDFEYYNVENDQKCNRRQYIAFLKKTKNLRYDCKTSYRIMDETSRTCMAKVVMEFDNFTRIDYITLCCLEDSWQISKVVTTYP